MTRFDAEKWEVPSRIVSEVKDFDVSEYWAPKDAKRCAPPHLPARMVCILRWALRRRTASHWVCLRIAALHGWCLCICDGARRVGALERLASRAPSPRCRYDRYAHYAMAAAKNSIADSGIDLDKVDKKRFGVLIGSGVGGLEAVEESCRRDRQPSSRVGGAG